LNGSAQRFANDLDRDTIVNLLEKAFHDHVHGFVSMNPAAHAVEDLFFVDSTSRRTVSAFDIVRLNFEAWNGITSSVIAQHQRIASLISVGLLSSRINLDHATPDDTSFIPQNFLVKQIAVSALSFVMLLSVIADFLTIADEGHAVYFRRCGSTIQVNILMDVSKLAAQTNYGPLQGSIAVDATCLMGKVP
jgi:hypothetical protein